MKKFRTWYDQIEEVEVIRETARQVVLPADAEYYPNGECHDAKRSENGYNYFDTWQEAKSFLVDRTRFEIFDLATEIGKRQLVLQKLQEMSQP